MGVIYDLNMDYPQNKNLVLVEKLRDSDHFSILIQDIFNQDVIGYFYYLTLT